MPLIAILKASPHERFRDEAILLLGQLRDRRAVPVLANLLQASAGEIQYSDIGDRAVAAQALGMIGDTSAIELLVAASKDGDEKVVLRAAEALSQFQLSIVVEPLIQILQKWNGWHFFSSEQPKVVQAIAQTLAQIGDQRAIEPLIQVLAWIYEFPCGMGMQEEADRTGGGSPIPTTGNILAADQAIAAALTQLSGMTISDLLLGMVRDPAHPLRETAAIALGRVGDLTLVPVIDALQDNDAVVRRSAAGALGMMYDKRGVRPLIETLQDADDAVILQAIESLRWLSVRGHTVPEVIPILCQLLSHPNWQIREAAARALSQSPDEESLMPLVATFNDPNPAMRKSAVFALRYLGDERAIAPRRLPPQESEDLHNKWEYDRKWLKKNYEEIPSTPRQPVLRLTSNRRLAISWYYYYGYYYGDWVDGRVCRAIAREADLRPSMTSDRWELVLIEGWQEALLAYSSALYTRFPDWLDSCEFAHYPPHIKNFRLVAGTEERIKGLGGVAPLLLCRDLQHTDRLLSSRHGYPIRH
ncbi:HEAT repeat domain-containing protein [Pantanalinema sp. GBBB05]|uniref:HEAT repeat domain-containing protein n=1 Tax=Pantanalinema sp. GBBB05 TaxID=2604139 RepID=UPI003D8171FC